MGEQQLILNKGAPRRILENASGPNRGWSEAVATADVARNGLQAMRSEMDEVRQDENLRDVPVRKGNNERYEDMRTLSALRRPELG